MPFQFWDASAMAKRYTPEIGTPTVNTLFATGGNFEMVLTLPGYAEIYSILRRSFNRRAVSSIEYQVARSAMRFDMLENPNFEVLEIENQILGSLELIDRHNINSTDAVILAAYLDYQLSIPASDQPCVLVASDLRLLRAAAAEGLAVLNPETLAPRDVAAFLSAL